MDTMARKYSGQSLRVGLSNGKAWIGIRTFDGIETDLTREIDDLDLEEVRYLHTELGKLLPEMEEADRAEKEKRREELLRQRQAIERQLQEIDREIAFLPAEGGKGSLSNAA